MFERSSRFYDALYSWKDYSAEAGRIHELIQTFSPGTKDLLDVACGTGLHLGYLTDLYYAEGLDLNTEFLQIARERLPDVPLRHGDMEAFDLGRRFGAVTCLFSSIGYVLTVDRLRRAIAAMTAHVRDGGVLLVEPWFAPEAFTEGHLGALFVDEDDLKIARMNDSSVRDGVSHFTFHYLVATREGISYFTEQHSLGLFEHDDYVNAFVDAGLEVTHDPEGLMGRGLYIGVRPAA
jgi:SAM-dependent methyltransferase